MKHIHTLILICALATLSCQKAPQNQGGKKPETGQRRSLTLTPIQQLNQIRTELNSHAGLTSRSVLSPIAGTYIELDKSVTREDKALYPRFVRTGAGDYLMYYHYGNSTSNAGNECEYLRSTDLVNWTWEKKPFAAYSFTDCTGASNKRGYAGAHLIRLQDGRLMCVASTRAISAYRDRIPDNGLSIIYSSDNGKTWTAEQQVLIGTNWEPFPIQLADGTIQIYYTDSKKLNSNAFGDGKEVISSGGSYIWSDDNGKSWKGGDFNASSHQVAMAQVRYTHGNSLIMTDQMLAVIELNGSKKLAAAAESFIGGADYKSYISLAYSDEQGSWGKSDAKGRIPADRKDNFISGCAPYLVQFPSGETVLSYNEGNIFYMRQGDESAQNWGDAIKVFNQSAASGKGFWGSLYCADSHTLVAGIGGIGNTIQVGQFYLNHAIHAAAHNVSVDGANSEWQNSDEALYLCSLGASKATLRCAQDASHLYFLFEVTDADISKDDYICLYLSDPTKSVLGSYSLRVKASYSGLKTAGAYSGGWKDGAKGVEVSSAYDGSVAYQEDSDNGYIVEMSIEKSELPIKDGKILVNLSLFDIKNGGEDAIVPTADKSTEDWIEILL